MLTEKSSLNSNENLQNENKSSQKEPVSQKEVAPIVVQEISIYTSKTINIPSKFQSLYKNLQKIIFSFLSVPHQFKLINLSRKNREAIKLNNNHLFPKYLENMRKEWPKYSKGLSKEELDLVWSDWSEKFSHPLNESSVVILRKFIGNEFIPTRKIAIKNGALIFKELNSWERSQYHKLCDHIGLHHESKDFNGVRCLHIFKPDEFLFEFSKANPYSMPKEYYEKRNKEALERVQRINEKLKRIQCDECGTSAYDDQLFCSVYIEGKYCQECLENTSDGEGGKLDDHKFEPYD